MENSHKDRGEPMTVFDYINKLGRMWNESKKTAKIAAEEFLKIERDVSRRFRELNYLFRDLHLSMSVREDGKVFIEVFGKIAGKEVLFKVSAELRTKQLCVLAKPAEHLDNEAYTTEVGDTLKSILNSTVKVHTAYVRQSNDYINAQVPYQAISIALDGGILDENQEKLLFDFIYSSTSDHWKSLFKPLMNTLLVAHYAKPDRLYLATA